MNSKLKSIIYKLYNYKLLILVKKLINIKLRPNAKSYRYVLRESKEVFLYMYI